MFLLLKYSLRSQLADTWIRTETIYSQVDSQVAKANDASTSGFSGYLQKVQCDSRKVHYLSRECHVILYCKRETISQSHRFVSFSSLLVKSVSLAIFIIKIHSNLTASLRVR